MKMLRQECSLEKYKAYNCVLCKSIRHAKSNFYRDMCHDYQYQTKKLWRLINEISGKSNDKSGLIEYLKIDGVKEYNSQNISNKLAKYFAGVGKKFASKIKSSKRHIQDYLKLLHTHQTSLILSPTCNQAIRKIVSKLPSKASSSHDNISYVLLKEIIDPLSQVLVEVFNRSMTQGEFPMIMKLAEVVPLYKGKEHYLETNYRPISLLTTISKILEKIIYQRVYSFLQNIGQLYENQYGFRANHSCEHAIGQVISTIVKGLENKQYAACILLDLSKAFDTIEHNILLQKLESYGIRGNTLSWFESYLTNCTLRVKCRTVSSCNESVSEEQLVEYGTPQGSCLGPLIFLIFVNDLHLHLRDSECIQFAHNTTLVFTHRNLNFLRFSIESKLSTIQDWFNANKLTLNVDKSVYLLYHNHNQNIPSFKIKLNGMEIPRVKEAKLLGVWLDDQLKWDTHTNKLLNKLKCGIGMLKCSKNLLSSKAKRLLYFGQVHSNLCYSLCIWGSMLQSSMLKKIANMQNKALKLIDPKLDSDEIFRKHKILKFVDMVKVEQCKLGYKLCHDLLPKALANNMVRDHNMHSISKCHKYQTRGKSIPNLPIAKGHKYRSSFLFNAIKLCSELDKELLNCQNLPTFVKHCKKLTL